MTATTDPTLTRTQAAVLRYIAEFIRDNGFPPAVRDIGRAFSIASPNGVMCHVRALRKKGYLPPDDESGKARTLIPVGLGVVIHGAVDGWLRANFVGKERP